MKGCRRVAVPQGYAAWAAGARLASPGLAQAVGSGPLGPQLMKKARVKREEAPWLLGSGAA